MRLFRRVAGSQLDPFAMRGCVLCVPDSLLAVSGTCGVAGLGRYVLLRTHGALAARCVGLGR